MPKDYPYPTEFILYTQSHIFSGCIAVAIWDVLCHLIADVRIVFFQRFTWKTIVFVIARLSPIGYFITVLVRTALSPVNCDAVQPAFRCLLVLFRSSTTLLLLFRVDAIFRQKPLIRAFFATLWLVTVGAFMFLVIHGMVTLTPNRCLIAMDGLIAMPALLLELLDDTLMCCAILYKLGGETWKQRVRKMKMLFSPRGLFLQEVVVQDTLIYAGFAILANFAQFISCLGIIPLRTDVDISFGLIHPGVLIANLISLRIYRNMKLGEPGLAIPGSASGALGISNLVFNVTPGNAESMDTDAIRQVVLSGGSTTSNEEKGHSDTSDADGPAKSTGDAPRD